MITVRILTSGVLFTAGALLLSQIGSDAKPEKQPYQEHEEPAIERQKSVDLAPQALPSPSLTPDTSIVDPDRADLNAWAAETIRVLYSPRFQTNMVALQPTYSTIWLSGDVGTRDPSALQQLLTSPSGNFRYVSTRLTWKANRRKISVGSDSRTRHTTAVMYIGRNHLARFRSTDQVERSCAINSLAHEITHTMSASSTVFETAVTDTGTGRIGAGNNPFASYFVGAVAQCTYLQELGRVTSEGLQQCIETFGARVFWGGRCGSFKNGEAVKWPKDRRLRGS